MGEQPAAIRSLYFRLWSARYDFLTSHERARRSHIPHLGEVSQIEQHKSVVISPRGRFHDLFQGIILVERQGRGKSSELSCLEIGVG